MRRLLALTSSPFVPTIKRGADGPTAYFGTLMQIQVKPRGTSTTYYEPIEIDSDDPKAVEWLNNVRRHYAPKGFTVMPPDPDDGTVEIRFYTTGEPPAFNEDGTLAEEGVE